MLCLRAMAVHKSAGIKLELIAINGKPSARGQGEMRKHGNAWLAIVYVGNFYFAELF